jgi:hypothetical protein
MENINKTIKIVCTTLGIQFVIFLFFYLYGFRITYAPELETSWEAISAIGQWVGALSALLIPIAVVYLDKHIDRNRKTIGDSNSKLLGEFEEFKNEYYGKMKVLMKLVNDEGDIVIDGGFFSEADVEKSDEILKQKALKFINISMVATTEKVADYLKIEKERAFKLLEELLKHEKKISAGGQVNLNNIDGVIWLKKNSN